MAFIWCHAQTNGILGNEHTHTRVINANILRCRKAYKFFFAKFYCNLHAKKGREDDGKWKAASHVLLALEIFNLHIDKFNNQLGIYDKYKNFQSENIW